nr:acyl-CoA dehydrogenase family protein [Variibacter gotjawalensis]
MADPQTINKAPAEKWRPALWQTLEESVLTLAWVPDDLGGAGTSLAEGFEVLDVAGRFATPIPLAETLLAGWLLSRAKIASPQGAMSVIPCRPNDTITVNADGTLSGRAQTVPFARETKHLAVLATGKGGVSIALVETDKCQLTEARSLARDPADNIVLDRVMPKEIAHPAGEFDQTALMLMGAAVRAQQTAGALQRILDISVRYANERIAFEKPLAKFQAIQHNLARLAGEVAAAMTAASSAADAISNADAFDEEIYLEAASAKIRTSEAAQESAAIAHQVHGAIGFTDEHILHRFTLRMLGWRDDFGSESYWAVELGRRVAARGADAFWPLLASR